MECALSPGASHSIPSPETIVAGINFNDYAGGAVAERRRCLQPIPDFLQSASPTQSFRGIEDFPYLVRPGPGLLQQVHFGLLDLHLLRANADHRMSRAHEHTSGRSR